MFKEKKVLFTEIHEDSDALKCKFIVNKYSSGILSESEELLVPVTDIDKKDLTDQYPFLQKHNILTDMFWYVTGKQSVSAVKEAKATISQLKKISIA